MRIRTHARAAFAIAVLMVILALGLLAWSTAGLVGVLADDGPSAAPAAVTTEVGCGIHPTGVVECR